MKYLLTALFIVALAPMTTKAQEVAFYGNNGFERGLVLIDEEGNESFFEVNSIFGEQPGPSANVTYDPSSGLYFLLVDPSNANGDTGYSLVSIDPATGVRTLLGNYNSSTFGLSNGPRSALFLNLGGLNSAGGFGSDFEEAIDSSSAVASALEIQLPVNGATNRIGFNTGVFGDEQALGFTYARVQGRFDIGLAYAQGDRGRNAGKVSVGFSW